MKALTIILRIRINYENAYIGMLQACYKLTDYVNAYITHSTHYKYYHINIVNAYMNITYILQCYNNITLDTLDTLCKHDTNLDIPTMKALTVPIYFPVSSIECKKRVHYKKHCTLKNTLESLIHSQ